MRHARPSSLIATLRARARGLAVLALVAMALQIVGSFGHVHVGDLKSAAAKSVAAKASPAQAFGKGAFVTSIANDPALPPANDGDALCAICLAGHLVGSAVFTAPPVLALPIAYLLLGPPHPVLVLDEFDAATAFWSRGPPLA